jgi:hypothetical protein
LTSITVAARSRIYSSSVIGLSLMIYLPSVCSTCQASRHSAGLRFFSQKMHAVTSGGTVAIRHLCNFTVLRAEDLLKSEFSTAEPSVPSVLPSRWQCALTE